MFLFENLYETMKDEEHAKLYGQVYFNRFMEKYINRFVWESNKLSQETSTRLEELLVARGKCGLLYKNDKIIVYDGDLTGELDENGIGKRFVGTTLNGDSIDVDRNEIVLIYNNKLALSDVPYILMKSDFMKECEISEKTLMINSRATKIPIASTITDKHNIDTAIESNRQGKVSTIVSPSSAFQSSDSLQTLDITSPEHMKLMECITAYKQNVLQEICAEMGISISGKDKKAQMNETELKPLTQYAMITLSDNYECRKNACEEFREKFNIEISCELNTFFDDENAEDTQDIIEHEVQEETENENN